MEDLIAQDYGTDIDGRKRITLIMGYFADPMDSYDTIKRIYALSPHFIRFCYKALGIRPGFQISKHKYGFKGTPHTLWHDFETNTDGQFLKDMLFEVAFRMLQQVFNSYPLDNTYEYIKHANTALARCRVCEIIWDNNAIVKKDLGDAKEFFIWFIEVYNTTEIHYELYEYTSTANSILTTIYYYNTIYALKYDHVKKKEAYKSLNKFLTYVEDTDLLSQQIRDNLIQNIDVKYYNLDE